MGLKEFFASRRASRSERQIERAARKLMNKHIQSPERKRAIEILESAGTTEAVRALLGRFTFRTQVQIVDEDEKEFAYQALLRLGATCIPAIEEFVHTEEAIYWPLRALAQIAGEHVAVALLLREIDGITENYDRDVARKHELVSNLREFRTPAVFDKLTGLLKDETEEVRILAIDGLSFFEDVDPAQHLVPLLLAEEETVRVKQMILDMVIHRGWNVKKFKKELTPKLPEQFWIDDTGVIQRR